MKGAKKKMKGKDYYGVIEEAGTGATNNNTLDI
jgi:hypothetical protein